MTSEELSHATRAILDAGDANELTFHVDRLVAAGAWAELARLRELCQLAFQRGKQLWAVSAYIEYRLCLGAPGHWAVEMLEAGSGRFALGPLAEVVASVRSWGELSPHVHRTPQAGMAAQERVVRGEDLRADPVAASLPEVLDLPLRIEAWEPSYALAEYHEASMEAPAPHVAKVRGSDRDGVEKLDDLGTAAQSADRPSPRATAAQSADRPSPRATGAQSADRPSPRATAAQSADRPSPRATAAQSADRCHDDREATLGKAARNEARAGADEVTAALQELVGTWTAESNGRATAVAFRGGVAEATAATGLAGAHLEEIEPQCAMAMMAWAAASGGAHGHRRGAAAGRFAAWWVLAAIGGLTRQWPLVPADVGRALESSRWYTWEGAGLGGWSLRVAVETGRGPSAGTAWVLDASDCLML